MADFSPKPKDVVSLTESLPKMGDPETLWALQSAVLSQPGQTWERPMTPAEKHDRQLTAAAYQVGDLASNWLHNPTEPGLQAFHDKLKELWKQGEQASSRPGGGDRYLSEVFRKYDELDQFWDGRPGIHVMDDNYGFVSFHLPMSRGHWSNGLDVAVSHGAKITAQT